MFFDAHEIGGDEIDFNGCRGQESRAASRRKYDTPRSHLRVFVSSTFTDLKHERDALQRDVFPKLEQLCASRQFQFQAIDLRWSVPSEA
ncbi:MAG: DUF4062 domain-containing protein, partial [Verrucomicrobia bacterium]|nr:DUF4062 domain-containing protein [Verrucomicrobiota bacterium]